MINSLFKKLAPIQWGSAFLLTCFLLVSHPAIAKEPKGLPPKPSMLPGKIKRDSNGKLYLEPLQQPMNKNTLKSDKLKKVINTKTLYKDWVRLTWKAPTQNIIGKPLHDLAGFRIYFWTENNSKKQVRDVKKALSYTLKNLNYGETYYFTVTAYDKNLVESDYSEIIAIKLEKPAGE